MADDIDPAEMPGAIPADKFLPSDPTDMDPQSAVAAQGIKQGAQAAYESQPVQNAITGQGLKNAYNDALSASQGDQQAASNVAGRSLGTAMASIKGPKFLDGSEPLEGAIKLVHPNNPETNVAGNLLGGDYDWWLGQGAEHESNLPYENPALLETLSVHPDLQNQGLGHKLYQSFEKEAKKQGADSIFTNASPMGVAGEGRNASKLNDLVNFYKSNGFEEYGPREESNQMMIKDLRSKSPKKSAKSSMESGGTVSRPPTLNAMQYYPEGGDVAQAPTPIATSPQALEDPSQMPGAIPADQFQGAAPSGETVDPSQMPGAIPADQFQSGEEHFGSAEQQILTGLEGAAQGLFGPLAPAAEIASGLTTAPEIAAREAANPYTAGLSKAGAFLGSALLGLPVEAQLVGKAGEAVAHALPLAADAASLSAKIGAGALRGATELGLLSASDEVTKQILTDPATATQNSMVAQPLSDILANVAVGGVAGGFFGAVAPLLAKAAPEVAQFIEDVKGTLNSSGGIENRVENMSDELNTRYNQVNDAMKGTFGKNGLKLQAIREALPPMSQAIADSIEALINHAQNVIDKNAGNPLYNELKNQLEAFKNEVTAPAITESDRFMARNMAAATGQDYVRPVSYATHSDPAELFDATNRFKQAIADQASIGTAGYNLSPTEKPFVNAMRALSSRFTDSLENNHVWGKAGDIQADVNEAASKMFGPLKLFEKHFTKNVTDDAGHIIKQIDPGTIQTLINQLGKPNSEVKIDNAKAFLDSAGDFFNQLNKVHGVMGDSLIEPSSLAVTNRYLGKYTLGMKMGDALLTKGVQGISNVAGAALGIPLGGAFGPEAAVAGAYLGKEALGPLFQKILPTLGKSLFDNVGNGPGMRSASKFITNVAKGNDMISAGAKNLFKAGAEVLPLNAIPSLTQLSKLDKQLQFAQNNPQQFSNNITNNHLGIYMPQQAEALGQGVTNTVQYLNTQRPDTTKKLPLDSERTPSAIQKAAFNNALSLAQQPAMILSKIKDGTITPDDIKHISSMSPAAYQHMQGQVSEAMTDFVNKGGSVPYQTRAALSIFMQQPMDSTFTPTAILSAQPGQGGGGQPQAPAAQAPKQGNKSSTKNLHTLSDQALTPLQARQKAAGGNRD